MNDILNLLKSTPILLVPIALTVLVLVLGKPSTIQRLIGLGGKSARFAGMVKILSSISVNPHEFLSGASLLITGRVPTKEEASTQARVLDTLKKMGQVTIFSCFLLSCSNALQRAAQECPVPTVHAALAVASVAADVAETYCGIKPVEGCDAKVHSVRVVIEKSDSTLDDVCRALPALETLDCKECASALSAAKKASCK